MHRPRVDPAQFLGVGTGEAVVERDIGGRVTPAVRVSGHVYDVKTGLVSAVVDARSRKPA
jgi:carbonic anhydrase